MLVPMALAFGMIPLPDLVTLGAGAPHVTSGGVLCASLGGMMFLRPPLMEAEDDVPPGSGGGGKGDGPQATMTIAQRFVAAASLIAKGEKAVADLNATIDQLTSDVSARDATITELQGNLTAANERVAALEAEAKATEDALKAIETESEKLKAKEADVEKRADSKAKEKVAALGFPAGKLPAATSDNPGEVSAEDQIRKLRGSERIRAGIEFKQKGKLPDWVPDAVAKLEAAAKK